MNEFKVWLVNHYQKKRVTPGQPREQKLKRPHEELTLKKFCLECC